jgi:predicted amidophosphoribosyltransferase
LIQISQSQLLTLAQASFKHGRWLECKALLKKMVLFGGSNLIPGDLWYSLAVCLAANDHYADSHEIFSEIAKSESQTILGHLSQERAFLLKRITGRQQGSVEELRPLLEEAKVKTPADLDTEFLLPEVKYVGYPTAYRSGYDKQQGDPLSTLIRMLKRGVSEDIVHRIGEYVTAYVKFRTKILYAVDYVIPVPTRPERQTIRGYSVPAILAEQITNYCALPLHDELVRTSNKEVELRRIPRWYRARAIEGAFEPGKRAMWVADRKILIVDDIITTGATIKEVARLLLKNGAKEIYAVALAHTERS